jgi:hypothetical protein
MTITTHPAAPEEIMALLDGELSSADAQALSAHLEECADCAKVADQFRRVARSLSAWTVPMVPSSLDESINARVAKTTSGRDSTKPPKYIRLTLWNWRLWAVGGAGAATAVLVLAAIVVAIRNEPEKAVMSEMRVDEGRFAVKAPNSESYSNQTPQSSTGLMAVTGNDKLETRNRVPRASGGGGYQPAIPAIPVPMIARTASLTIMVKDIAAARSGLDSILARHGGYSAQLTVALQDDAPPRGIQASLRIPAPELAGTLVDLRALGWVQKESQSGEEVTEQHVDLVARLKNSRETEERLRAILQQRTGKVEDILQVEEEIARVRGEIDGMEAEQKALEHRVDFATIDLQLIEEYKEQFNRRSVAASTRMHNAFVAGMRNVSETLLEIVLFLEEFGPTILVWLAILGLPAALVWRRYRRRHSGV